MAPAPKAVRQQHFVSYQLKVLVITQLRYNIGKSLELFRESSQPHHVHDLHSHCFQVQGPWFRTPCSNRRLWNLVRVVDTCYLHWYCVSGKHDHIIRLYFSCNQPQKQLMMNSQNQYVNWKLLGEDCPEGCAHVNSKLCSEHVTYLLWLQHRHRYVPRLPGAKWFSSLTGTRAEPAKGESLFTGRRRPSWDLQRRKYFFSR